MSNRAALIALATAGALLVTHSAASAIPLPIRGNPRRHRGQGRRPPWSRSSRDRAHSSPDTRRAGAPVASETLRSLSLIGKSLMLAKRRVMKPCSLNSQFSLP